MQFQLVAHMSVTLWFLLSNRARWSIRVPVPSSRNGLHKEVYAVLLLRCQLNIFTPAMFVGNTVPAILGCLGTGAGTTSFKKGNALGGGVGIPHLALAVGANINAATLGKGKDTGSKAVKAVG